LTELGITPARSTSAERRKSASDSPAQHDSRKQLNLALKKLSRSERGIMSASAIAVEVAPAQITAQRAARVKRKTNFLSIAVTAVLVPGLFATVALPAYALVPTPDTSAEEATASVMALKQSGAQSVTVSETAAATAVARDAFSATTAAELRRAKFAATYKAYAGPTVRDFLANPAYPSFSLDQVVQVAMQYQGVPYVYGGASPSGFDCSGLVMFVYAQFGVALPHSVVSQAAIGTKISAADARPGDIVTWSDGSHNGIYLGNGVVLHAPYPGASVRVQPIWGSVYFVRVGI